MALFIIPEGAATGKGANQVISMLHFYLENLSLGEAEVVLNADNCVGQNKNQFMISYLCWRILSGTYTRRSHSIFLSWDTQWYGILEFNVPPWDTQNFHLTMPGVCSRFSGVLHAQHRLMLRSVPASQQYSILLSQDLLMENSRMCRCVTGRVNLQASTVFWE